MTPFSRQPGFLIAGFDLGHGRYTVTASDQVFDWELNRRVSHVDVRSFGDLSTVYVPGPQETELAVRARLLHMAEGTDFCHALAGLMQIWAPSVPALRGQAGLMAAAKDFSR